MIRLGLTTVQRLDRPLESGAVYYTLIDLFLNRYDTNSWSIVQIGFQSFVTEINEIKKVHLIILMLKSHLTTCRIHLLLHLLINNLTILDLHAIRHIHNI